MEQYYTDNVKERNLRKLYWLSLVCLPVCSGLLPLIPKIIYVQILCAAFSLFYIIRDTIKFWKWAKKEENELNEKIKQINKKNIFLKGLVEDEKT